MWFFVIGIIFLILTIIGIFACSDDYESILIILGFWFLSIICYTFGLDMIFSGYPIGSKNLPIYGVCEVITVKPVSDESNKWITLMQLPDGDFRLFQLTEKPEIGTVKIQKDYSLKPFSLPDKSALGNKNAEAVSP